MPNANSTEKNELKREFGELRGLRGTFENHWAQVAQIASPRDDIFQQEDVTQGVEVRSRQYDETPELALDDAAAFYGSVTTPENSKWHGITTSNPELNKIQQVKEFLDVIVERLFKLRYAPRANYATTKYESDRSLIGFGTKVYFNGQGQGDPRTRVPLFYRPIHLSECFLSENELGFVDKLYRRRRMTGRQIVAEYGEENIGTATLQRFTSDSETMHTVIHAVLPNPNWSREPDEIDPNKFRYMSRHWLDSGDDELYLRAGGFRTWPYSVTRDSRRPTEQYGRGTLMKVLPAIKMLNQMKRSQIRAGHLITDPIILAVDDSSIDMRDMRAGHRVVGGLAPDGTARIAPFQSGARYDVSIDMLQHEYETIKHALGLHLFVSEVNDSGRERVNEMELMMRDQEKSRLMTPLAAKDEAEGLQTQVEREIDIMQELGMIPEVPGELLEAGGEYEIEFTNPLAVSRRSDEAIGAVQTVQRVLEAVAIVPEMKHTVNWPKYTGIIANSNNTPATLLNSPEEYQALLQLEQEQQQLQMAAQAAPGVGRGIKDIASAEQIAEGAAVG